MSVVDRVALSRCCALFGGLSWACAAIMVLAASIMLGHIAAVPEVSVDTLAAGGAPAAMAVTAALADDSLRTFAVALAAFGILAVGSIVAGIGLATGRRVLLAGGPDPLVSLGLISSTAYLAAIGGLLVRTLM